MYRTRFSCKFQFIEPIIAKPIAEYLNQEQLFSCGKQLLSFCANRPTEAPDPKRRIEENPKTHYNEIDRQATRSICCTHNQQLLDYSRRYLAICQQADADPETGCIEFDMEKVRFSFRLTAPYSDKRREAARQYVRENHTADRLN